MSRKLSDGLFLRECTSVAEDYPSIEFNSMIIDNCCMQVRGEGGGGGGGGGGGREREKHTIHYNTTLCVNCSCRNIVEPWTSGRERCVGREREEACVCYRISYSVQLVKESLP